jgi:hypothetical protein
VRKNVAGQIVCGQLNSKTDGSAVTSGTTTCYVLGDGGTQAAGSVGSGACTHEGNGLWSYAPAQAETNYDNVVFTFVNASAVIASVQIYPSFPQTGDNFARLGAPAGASVSADVAAVKTDTAAVKVQTDKLAFTVANQIDANVIDWKGATAPAMTGDAFARLGAPAGASVSADVAATKALLPTALVGGRMDSSLGAVAVGVDFSATMKTALDAATPASVVGAVGSVTGSVGGNVVGSVGSVTGITASDVGAIKAKTDNLPTDPADESLIIAATNSLAGLIGTPAGVSLSADVAAAKTDTAAIKLKTDNLPASPAAVSDIPSAAANASATWDEALAGHATAGTTGKALSDAGAAGDPWATALPGAYGAGTAGEILGTNLDATVSSRSTYAGGDTTGTTTLLARLSAARAGYLDNLSAGAVALEASLQGLITTVGAAAAGVASAVWGAATRILTAGTNIVLAKGTGVTGFNDITAANVKTQADQALADAGVMSVRQAHLDADVSSRLPTSSYVAPDNTGIGVAATAAASAASSAAAVDAVTGSLVRTGGRLWVLDGDGNAIATEESVAAIVVPTPAENADGLLARNIAGGSDGGHIVTDALRPLRNRTEIVGSDLNVYAEDGTTVAWTAPITRAPGDPLAGIDPA